MTAAERAALQTMEMEGKPRKVLGEELESLRRDIERLQSLVLGSQDGEKRSEGANGSGKGAGEILPTRLFDDLPLGMALIDDDFRIVRSNRALSLLLEFPEQEIRSRRIYEFWPDAETCKRAVGPVLEGSLPFCRIETEFFKCDRESVWVQLTAVSLGGEGACTGGCLCALEDISARKRAELALQSEKQSLERLINSSLDGIVAFDRELRFTVFNPAMEKLCGVGAKEALGRPAFEVCPFLLQLGEDANFAAALRGERVISRDKSHIIPGTVRQAHCEYYYSPLYDDLGGAVIGGLAIIREVTERKMAEEAKRASEDRYRELFENAYDMVYTLDLTGRITSVNKAAERILGYPRTEALEMRFSEFAAPECLQKAQRMIERLIADGIPTTEEIDIIAKDGSRVTLEVSNRPVFREGTPLGIQGIARDVTERKKTEEALQQANQKLEAWVQELEQRTREMTLLSEMGDVLRACLTTREIYEVIVRAARDIFPLQGGALFVLSPLRNMVEAVAEWGDTSRVELTFTPDECWALRRGRVHFVEDTRVGLLCKHLHEPPPAGYLCIPMMAQSEAVGILQLIQREDTPMPEAKVRLAVAMAEHVAMALSNLKLHETLRNQSIRDQLTGLFNRSFLEESLEIELRRAVRSRQPIIVIMLALDNFQMLTDGFGLDVGDSVLRRTAVMLQSNVRKGDIACRYSGQTYVVLLPNSSFEVGWKRAERLRDLSRTLEVKYQSEQVGHITVSIGLAVFPANGQTVESLLRSAEAALNRARNSGGDCVVAAT
jgi:diguanylate cyclase (GGDEF)-like protein/PAS domain S-box-containing protein